MNETFDRLVIVGAGERDSDYADALKRRAGERVIFTGRLPREDVDALLASATVFVLASSHEGNPIVALEAIRAGAPILLSDIAPNRDLELSPSVYFSMGDARALAAAMDRPTELLRVDPRVLDRFAWGDISLRTNAIYDRLASSAHAQGASGMSSLAKRRLVFVINSLTGGGAERALVNLLNAAQEALRPFETHLVLLDREPARHAVGAHVHVTQLDAGHSAVRSSWQLHETLKRLDPVATVSFLTRANVANVIASRLLGRPCIISERVQTTRHFGSGLKGRPGKFLVRAIYPHADAVVAVSQGVAEDLELRFGVAREKLNVIGNGVDVGAITAAAQAPPAIPLPPTFIVAAGRLMPNKNFGLLIRAYHQAGVGPPLVILGEGPERAALTSLVQSLGLEGRILMPGYVDSPFPVVARALAFVSASNAEGFPNALVEAMAVGCPVLATDCEAGPAEILDAPTRAKNGLMETPYGMLTPVENVDALADGLRRLMIPAVRARYAQAGRVRAAAFSPAAVVASYVDLIEKCIRISDVVREPGLTPARQSASPS